MLQIEHGDPLHRLQAGDAIFAGALQTLGQQRDAHFAAQGQEPANELVPLDAFDGQRKIQIGVGGGRQGAQVLFLRLGAMVAIFGRMEWGRLPRRAELFVFDPLGRQGIFDQTLAGLIDL